MGDKELCGLKEKLRQQEETIKGLKEESIGLKKAIWDMLNYANMYVLLLNSKMIITLINWSLATELGFKDEREPIGKCWLDFIPEEITDMIEIAHNHLAFKSDKKKYREVTNEVKCLDGKKITIKWFNIPINSEYHMTFSMGIKLSTPVPSSDITIVTEDSIRSYYKDIIEKDRTMIQSLRDVVVNGISGDSCKLTGEE